MNEKAKKAFLIIFILLCIGAIGFGGYTIVTNLNTSPNVTEPPTKPSNDSAGVLRVRIVHLEDSGFELYEENGSLILIYKGKEHKFDWTGTFTEETVQMNYADYDGNGQNELAIVITRTEGDKAASDELHILTVLENGTDITYRDTNFSSNSFRWNAEAELSAQQVTSNKRVAVTLNEETAYFRAPAKEDGSYYLFEAVDYGVCRFELVAGTSEIKAEIEVNAVFTDYQQTCVPGKILSSLTYDGAQYIYTGLTLSLDPAWSILPPSASAPVPFTLRCQNYAPKISTGLLLGDIEFTLEAGKLNGRNFDLTHSDERYLSEIVLTESYIELAVTNSMSFNDAAVQDTPPIIWFGGEDGCYIQSTTEVRKEGDFYYLRTYFDEKIAQADFSTLHYRFGA